MARKTVFGLAVVVATLVAGGVQAQDVLLAELYGQGVHAFFARDYRQSHELLTMAIDQGSQDPRAYYYRGLANSQLGRPEDARLDYKKGAELEAAGTGRIYPVSMSLQRIQGQQRLALERFRQTARLAIRLRNVKAAQARYEQMQRAEGQVLRDPNRTPSATASELVGPAPTEDNTDPFSGAAPEPMPAPPRPEPAAPAAGDILGGAPATPAPAATPAAEPAPADTTDPFGTDPFGGGGGGTGGTGGAGGSTEEMPSDDANTDPFADDPFGT